MSNRFVKIYEKSSGNIIETDYSSLRKNTLDRSHSHLCFDCENCSPAKCLKVFDVKKRNISNYDFISDGYQIIDKNGEIDSFVVSNCNNFKLEKRQELTIEKKVELKQKRREFVMAYFGASDMDEALEIREELEKSGNLRPYVLYKRKELKK